MKFTDAILASQTKPAILTAMLGEGIIKGMAETARNFLGLAAMFYLEAVR